jgi:hypothetical protein
MKNQLSKTKIKFYSSLNPEQFNHFASLVKDKVKLANSETVKLKLEVEYAQLVDLYVKLFNIKIGTLVEDVFHEWDDQDESERDFVIVTKFFRLKLEDNFKFPYLTLVDSDEDKYQYNEPMDCIYYKPVTTERFQWMVDNYPAKMIMVYNNPKLNLKSNPLFKDIKWPKEYKKSKSLVDTLTDIGL